MNKIKGIILSAATVLAIGAANVMAAQPVFISGRDSNYVVTHTTISVSSNAVATPGLAATILGSGKISAVSGYRRVKIQLTPTCFQDGTTVFISVSGSTANIYNAGTIVRVSTLAAGGTTNVSSFSVTEVELESSGVIYIVTAPGVIPVSGRVTQYRLPN